MARRRYDHQWKEVRVINDYCLLMTYVDFVIRGIGYLVVTWTTVVLLGGFVSMIDKQDFWRLTVITLIQILGIKAPFLERAKSSFHLLSSQKTVKYLFMRKRKLTGSVRSGHGELDVVKRAIRARVGFVLALLHGVLLEMCILLPKCLFAFGMLITTSLSIYGLAKRDYRGEYGDRRNLYPAHMVLFMLCVVQGALFLYGRILRRWEKKIVNKVSQAYGFQDGGNAVLDYTHEIKRGCEKKPSSAGERNLITYAIELMEYKSPISRLSGTLILGKLLTREYSGQVKVPTSIQQERNQPEQQQLDSEDKGTAQMFPKPKEIEEERKKKKEERRKKRQQREERIIARQRTVIKRLIGSASSTHILQKLLDTLDSKRWYDKKMRDAAARIVEHVAGKIRLEQFPGGINCISSLINNFEEYRRLQPDESSSSSSNTNESTTTTVLPSSNTNGINGDDQEQGSYSSSSSDSESEPEPEPMFEYSESEPESESSSSKINGYKGLVLTGLNILCSLAGSKENCIIISNTKHLISKIMAPLSFDLVHRTRHSEWSTRVVDASMRVMLRLMATAKDIKGNTWDDMCQDIYEAMTTMEKILTCEECKAGKLQTTAMQILMQLKGNGFNKMLIEFFIKGDRSDISIRKTGDNELVLLFLGNKSVAHLLYNEANDEFVGGLSEIVSEVGSDAECRKNAAGILEHMCIHYTKKDEYFRTLKNAMARAMPKVLREILLGHALNAEDGKPGRLGQLDADIESQDAADGKTNRKKKNNNNNKYNTCSSPWPHQHHKLYVALLSLYVTACEKLDLHIDTISPGEGDQGEGVAFRFARRMVQSNWNPASADSLTVMKLSTRMAIATMKKLRGTDRRVVTPSDLESFMDLLDSISKTMLDLEGSMVFDVGTTMVTATADTFDSLVTQAWKFLGEIKNQDSERYVT